MIKAIFAVDLNGGIGNRGTLPWPRNKEDMHWFVKNTRNNHIIMGRKSWEDKHLKKPMKDRTVWIASNTLTHSPYCNIISGDINSKILAIQESDPSKDVFITGGLELLESTKNIVEEVYITFIRGNYFSDVRVNLAKYLRGFRIKTVIPGETCTFCIYKPIF